MSTTSPFLSSLLSTQSAKANIQAVAVRLISTPPELQNNSAPVHIDGEVTGQAKSGAVIVETERGLVELMLGGRQSLPKGMRIEIDIPAGRAPQQASIRAASPATTTTTDTTAAAPQAREAPPTLSRAATAQGQERPLPQTQPQLQTQLQAQQAALARTANLDAETLDTVLQSRSSALQASATQTVRVPAGHLQLGQYVRLVPVPPQQATQVPTATPLPQAAVPTAATLPAAASTSSAVSGASPTASITQSTETVLAALVRTIQSLPATEQSLRPQLISLLSRIPVPQSLQKPQTSQQENLIQNIKTLVQSFDSGQETANTSSPQSAAAAPRSFNPTVPIDVRILGFQPAAVADISGAPVALPQVSSPQSTAPQIVSPQGLPTAPLATVATPSPVQGTVTPQTSVTLSLEPQMTPQTAPQTFPQAPPQVLPQVLPQALPQAPVQTPPQTAQSAPPSAAGNAVIPAATLIITPEILPASPAPAASSAAAMPPQVTIAQVVGQTAEGLPVVAVPAPASGFVQTYVMQFAAQNLQIPATPQAAPSPLLMAIEPQPQQAAALRPAGISSSLQDILSLLLSGGAADPRAAVGTAPSAAAQSLAGILPSPAHPQSFGASVLFFLSALQGGQLENWMPQTALDLLRQTTRGTSLLKNLADDLSSSSARTGAGALPHDWRGIMIPLLWEQQIHKIPIYYKHLPDESAENDARKKRRLRFLFDLTLSRMGGVQVDGFMDSQKLDLILRTKSPLSVPMQDRMKQLYAGATQRSNLTGELTFQFKPEQWVDFSQPLEAVGVEA